MTYSPRAVDFRGTVFFLENIGIMAKLKELTENRTLIRHCFLSGKFESGRGYIIEYISLIEHNPGTV